MGWSFASGRKWPLLLGFNWKLNTIVRINLQHFTWDESENPEIKEMISNYHMTLKSAIDADEFMSDLYDVDAFINEEVPSQE